MKNIKLLLSAISLVVFAYSNISASNSIKWHSFNEGLTKAKKEKKFLLVDFYTDWCHWCKVMDEKTYSQKEIIDYIDKHFVAVKLNPEKGGVINFNGESFSAADFARAANVSGYPATGFFDPNSEFINTIVGYQDAEKFTVLLEYLISKNYMQLGYEDYQLFKQIENRYNDDPQNADLNFVLGYFYQNVFANPKEAKKFYLKSIKNQPTFIEAYSSLYHLAKEGNNKSEIDKWLKEAESHGLKNEDEILDKLKNVIRLYL